MSEANNFLTDKWFLIRVMNRYFGDSWLFLAIFAVGLVYLLFSKKREADRLLGWITLLLGLTVYNPAVIKIVVPRLVSKDIYYRLLWMLPISVGTAYFVVRLMTKTNRKRSKCLIITVFAGAALVTSGVNPNLLAMEIPSNIYKVPDALIWANTVIHADYEEHKEEIKASYSKFYEHLSPRCVYEDELEVFASQYDQSIHLAISRDMRLYYNGSQSVNVDPSNKTYKRCKRILDVLNSAEKVSKKAFRRAMKARKVNYLVVNTGKPCHEYLINVGCEVIGEKDGYTVYRYIAPS